MTATNVVSADHHHTEQHDHPIHGHPRLAHEEDPDGNGGGDGGTQTYVEPEDRVETQRAARDVADVEHQAAQHVERREDVSGTGEHTVHEVLCTTTGAPRRLQNVQLDRDVEQGFERPDREGEAGHELVGERRGLGDEARADRPRRHEKHGTDGLVRPLSFSSGGLYDVVSAS